MMMKIKILPLLGMLTMGVRGPVLQTMFLSMEVGPFDKYQNDTSVMYKLESTYTTSKTIYEIFRFGDTANPNQQTVTKANHTVQSGATYTGYVTIPTKSLLGTNGMQITIEIYLSTGSRIKKTSCTVYPRTKDIINPTTYSGEYTCPKTRGVITNGVASYPTEKYKFTKVDDYFLTDVYYRLPFEQFLMETSLTGSEFRYDSASLMVEGMSEYFPGLTYKNNVATIPLQINYDSGTLTLSLKDNLYVEPKHLIMSTTSKYGYVATRNFYLPINHSKDLVGSSFSFAITGVGFNKSAFIWQTSILAESPLIGNCQNSGYCVVGTVTK